MYAIEYTEEAAENLKQVRAFDRQRILDAIDRQLTQTPTRPTRNRKSLFGLKPPWEHEETDLGVAHRPVPRSSTTLTKPAGAS